MTRQEAIDKTNECFVDGLEALGLLKFEENNIDRAMVAAIRQARLAYNDNDFARGLEKLGYKIVKAD